MKIPVSFRLDKSSINIIDILSEKTGMNKTEIIEFAIQSLGNMKLSSDEFIGALTDYKMKEIEK